MANNEKDGNLGKTLVVFYSRTGNTRFVAEEIATILGSDLRPLVDKKSRDGIIGYIWAGFDAMMQNKTRLEDYVLDTSQYDLIFIGCPNWAFNVPPAIRTFLNQSYLKDKKLVLFCTQEGSGAEKVFNNLRLLAKGADIVNEKFFNKVLANRDIVGIQVKEWLAQIVK